jgi:hypothetical protein
MSEEVPLCAFLGDTCATLRMTDELEVRQTWLFAGWCHPAWCSALPGWSSAMRRSGLGSMRQEEIMNHALCQ